MCTVEQKSKVEMAEQAGRDLFTTFLRQMGVECFCESEYLYDSLDMYIRHNGKTMGVEIKKRNKWYEDYPTYVMDYDKFCRIREKLEGHIVDCARYAVFFDDDTLYIFDMRKVYIACLNYRVSIEDVEANEMTVADSHRILKRQVFIPRSMASKYVRINGKWQKED